MTTSITKSIDRTERWTRSRPDLLFPLLAWCGQIWIAWHLGHRDMDRRAGEHTGILADLMINGA